MLNLGDPWFVVFSKVRSLSSSTEEHTLYTVGGSYSNECGCGNLIVVMPLIDCLIEINSRIIT